MNFEVTALLEKYILVLKKVYAPEIKALKNFKVKN
jgi:hypothetical protein